jgi:hypothetical protein
VEKVEELKRLLDLAAGAVARLPEFEALLAAAANLDPTILEKLISEVDSRSLGTSAEWSDTKFYLAREALLSAVIDPVNDLK